jgi:uncharacterized protein
MLWHVKGTKLYLLGSQHFLDQNSLGLTPREERVYRKSSRVVFECNLDAQPDPQLPDGTSLSQIVSPSLFAATRQAWDQVGIPEPPHLDRLPPWIAAMRLLFASLAPRGISSDAGVDKQLWRRAKGDRKKLLELEPASLAVDILRQAPVDEATTTLSRAVQRLEDVQNTVISMADAWRRRDLGHFEGVLADGFARVPQTYERLITGRTREWLPSLMDMAKRTVQTLAVVGALHCVGQNSLQALLSNAGLKVSPVK